MKQTLALLAGIVALACGRLDAQQPSPSPVALPKPILAKLPAATTWSITTVTRQGKPEKEEGSNTPKSAASGKKVFIKADDLMEVIRVDAAGRQTHQWRVGNTQYLIFPGTSDIGVMDPKSEEFIRGDFQELGWIKQSNFVGMQAYAGKECWVFKDRVMIGTQQEFEAAKKRAEEEKIPFNANGYYSEKIALVDSMTQLPVLVQQGDDIDVYAFGNPPAQPLKMPANLEQKAQADQQRSKAMQAGPPRPF